MQGDGFHWPTVLHSHGGQACPRCGVVVIGVNHKAQHLVLHNRIDQLEEAVRDLAAAVRIMATEAGHGDWYDDPESPVLGGVVIGSGPLPPEMVGGGE